MYATHRRYEGIDQSRIEELSRKVNDSLIPKLSKLPGFNGYFLIEAGEGVVKSTTFFDTSSQAEDSTRVAAEWMQEEKLEKLVPNAPKVTVRKVIAHETKAPVLV
ncbi:MAG: hypothetical protein ACJ8AE_00050 [Gemmatimonadaceae bacterium]